MKRRFLSLFLAGILATPLLVASCSRSEPEPGQMEDQRDLIKHARERRAVVANTQLLADGISRFQVELGRFPSNLYEVVRAGYITKVPPPPPGLLYRYDPVFGNLTFVKMTPEQLQAAQTPAPAK